MLIGLAILRLDRKHHMRAFEDECLRFKTRNLSRAVALTILSYPILSYPIIG